MRLYDAAFPENEKKPWHLILDKRREGFYDIFAVTDGDDFLGEGNSVILDEDDLDEGRDERVGIHDVRDGEDEFDDFLGESVARGRLGAEDVGVRNHAERGIFVDPRVEVHDMENVQKLPLISMETLDLHVVNRGGVDFDAIGFLDEGSEILLVLRFGIHDGFQGFFVVLEGQKF